MNFAVNFCMKCGQFFFTTFSAITAFLTKIHRIRRISYKISPKNLDPGDELWPHQILSQLNTAMGEKRADISQEESICIINMHVLLEITAFQSNSF